MAEQFRRRCSSAPADQGYVYADLADREGRKKEPSTAKLLKMFARLELLFWLWFLVVGIALTLLFGAVVDVCIKLKSLDDFQDRYYEEKYEAYR